MYQSKKGKSFSANFVPTSFTKHSKKDENSAMKTFFLLNTFEMNKIPSA